MSTGYDIYRENIILHGENARLRKALEAFEKDMEYKLHLSSLVASYEKKLQKLTNALSRAEKQKMKYHGLWQMQVKQNRHYEAPEDTVLIEELKKTIDELRKEKEVLAAALSEANATIAKLKAQMNRDHENSSNPSSQRPFHKKISNSRVRTGRKPGAQPGHTGHKRPFMKPSEPPVILPAPGNLKNDPDWYPTGKFIKKQLIDIEISMSVKEYRAEVWRNRLTGSRSHAAFPDGIVNDCNYGSNIKTLAFLLNNYCNVSIDKTAELLSGMTGGKIQLSRGMISSLPLQFSKATQKDLEQISAMLLLAPSMHIDFSPVRVNGSACQTMVCANKNEILYCAREHKGHAGIQGTPAEVYEQTLIHDHDKTFYSYGGSHQECLAHVLRYLQDSIDNEPQLKWSRSMKEFLQGVIHEVKQNGPLSAERIGAIKDQYDTILDTAFSEYDAHPPSKYYPDGFNLASRLRSYKGSHLYFLDHPEVDYTNNLAERELRKLKRKFKQVVTFRSDKTVEYLCNCMSVLETGRLQGASCFDISMKAFS